MVQKMVQKGPERSGRVQNGLDKVRTWPKKVRKGPERSKNGLEKHGTGSSGAGLGGLALVKHSRSIVWHDKVWHGSITVSGG